MLGVRMRPGQMSTKLEIAELKAPDYRSSYYTTIGPLTVSLVNLRDEGLATIDVEFGDKSYCLPTFAYRGPRDPAGNYPAIFHFISIEHAALILIGQFELFTLEVGGRLSMPTALFRKPIMDAGFFRDPMTIAKKGHILLRYESGIASFDGSGVLEWHVPLMLDDELVEVSEDRIRFSNEHHEGESWSIRLADGSVSK